MKFRLRAFGLHLLGSALVLSVLLGGLYVGWYRWPGWYLADVARVVVVMAAVDIALGPLCTLVIANPGKPRRELQRDVSLIVALQLCALIYGVVALWNGRPLYYAFSETVLQVVQAYDIDAVHRETAAQQNAPLVPHWYDTPRWIWAPLPKDEQQSAAIVQSAIAGGDDVVSMPELYQPWERGVPDLRKQLKKVDDIKFFSAKDHGLLAEQMRALSLPVDQANAMPLTGRGHPLLAVFEPGSMRLVVILKSE